MLNIIISLLVLLYCMIPNVMTTCVKTPQARMQDAGCILHVGYRLALIFRVLVHEVTNHC
jgi:hypothetical protein